MSGRGDPFHKAAKTGHGFWNGRLALEFFPGQPHKVVASKAVTDSACNPLLCKAPGACHERLQDFVLRPCERDPHGPSPVFPKG
jgi:hypothetical protein